MYKVFSHISISNAKMWLLLLSMNFRIYCFTRNAEKIVQHLLIVLFRRPITVNNNRDCVKVHKNNAAWMQAVTKAKGGCTKILFFGFYV